MHQTDSSHITPQAFDLFNDIEQIHTSPMAQPKNLVSKYTALYKLLQDICLEQTGRVTYSFANLFSRLDYLCKLHKLPQPERYDIQTMRRNGKKAMDGTLAPDMQEYLFDLGALARFVGCTFQTQIPDTLLTIIPDKGRPRREQTEPHIPYLRVAVESWNENTIFASTDSEDDPFIKIDYANAGKEGDLLYLNDILKENMQLNLLDVKVTAEHTYQPNLVIVCPDYLIDISSLAICFREYGHHPFNFFLNKIKPKANTAPILLGNLASQFLDDYVNEQEEHPVTYTASINKYFGTAALEFCTCEFPDPAQFHRQAQEQMANIRYTVHQSLPSAVPEFNKRNTLLEASFICEQLGLQGRVDMMQKDFKVLIEQKSGKRDEFHHLHKEDHFVQMMLYQGVLKYNFGKEAKDLQPFLFYSKYPDGLMRERFVDSLFRESMHLRNRIVTNEMAFGEGNISAVTEQLSAELLRTQDVHPKLWNIYQKPQLQEIIDTLKKASPLEKAYFERFFTFLSKEQILCKTGGLRDPGNSFAGLWHTPLAEKTESGNILTGLKITSKKQSAPSKGYDLIELEIPQQGDDFLPNFRTGDIVILYAYTDVPDVRKHILMKGNITELTPYRVTVILRNGQQNKDIIGSESDTFAIEHDYSDTSVQNSMRGLYTFLSTPNDRKQLLLGTRLPRKDTQRELNGSYGRFDELIRKEKQATDYFLLVGPPGTGKTSCALRYMVEEALTDPEASLLLLSYTNRAVDEICGMLVDSGIVENTPFIRLGNELSCDQRFRKYLLKYSFSSTDKMVDIQDKIIGTRIFVGTTTAINSRPYLFHLKRFSVAMIDESSQILEPDLIGILSAHQGGLPAIDKFVLIGDYKQLPAIALQTEDDARVTEPLLRAIGLTDCRNSLFERLYKQCPPEFRSVLHKQGRMHPAISDFPDNAFYFEEHLEPVPLPHQQEELPYPADIPPRDGIDRLLTERRMIFIPAETPNEPGTHSDKSNYNEARIVALLLAHVYRLTAPHFHPGKTVGVIVPYRNQIAMIRKEVAQLCIPPLNEISIDTVERYQGSQRDIIIYSFTVRNISQLNFLTANTFAEGEYVIDRKLNVAITRARKQLILTGNPTILGIDHTFYKLMQYIRQHNGYIETNTEHFLKAEFEIPCAPDGWDLRSANYPLTDSFAPLFEKLIGEAISREQLTDTRCRELTGYGRIDFSNLPPESANLSTEKRLLLFNYLYMRRTYTAALSFFQTYGSNLSSVFSQTSGRILFCDLSQETAASGLAFFDSFGRSCYIDMSYCPITIAEMRALSARFFQDEAYRSVRFISSSESAESLSGYQSTLNTPYAQTVVFNVSNLFDRIPTDGVKAIAHQINEVTRNLPQHQYVILFHDDAGPCAGLHGYRTFRSCLDMRFRSILPQAPAYGGFYYKPAEEGVPQRDTYVCDILIKQRRS